MEVFSHEQQCKVRGDEAVFPLCMQGDLATVVNFVSDTASLDNLLKKHAGILFRISDATSHQHFHEVVEATKLQEMEYMGGAAVRTQLTSRVFTANESPASEKIPFHHELAQTPQPPTHIMFFCEVEPETGGETPIVLSGEVCRRLEEVNPSFVSLLQRKGVKYVRVMSEEDDNTSAIGRGWKSTFNTQDKDGAEAALTKLGSTWEWLENGDLKTCTKVLPAIREESGEKVFFNSIVAAYTGWNDSRNKGEKAVVLGDEDFTVCPSRGIEDAISVMDELSSSIPWRRGDVLILDNRRVMHSRKPFTGPRRILAALARDHQR